MRRSPVGIVIAVLVCALTTLTGIATLRGDGAGRWGVLGSARESARPSSDEGATRAAADVLAAGQFSRRYSPCPSRASGMEADALHRLAATRAWIEPRTVRPRGGRAAEVTARSGVTTALAADPAVWAASNALLLDGGALWLALAAPAADGAPVTYGLGRTPSGHAVVVGPCAAQTLLPALARLFGDDLDTIVAELPHLTPDAMATRLLGTSPHGSGAPAGQEAGGSGD